MAADKPSDVLARGKNLSVTRADLDAAFARLETEATNAGSLIAEEDRPGLRASMLDRLIFQRLCAARATEADQRRARFEAEAFVRGEKEVSTSPEAFARALRRRGLTGEAEFLTNRYAETLAETVVDRELRSTIQVGDDTVRAAYQQTTNRWQRPASYRAALLLIATRDLKTGQEFPVAEKQNRLKRIQELKARADQGEDFTALVKQFSDDLGTRARGGEYTFGRGQIPPEIEAATARLKPGQVSEPVRTEDGYHLVKLIERLPAGLMPIEQVAARIRTELVEAEVVRQLPDYVARLRREAGVELTAAAPKPPSKK